ncbi:MAG: nucleotidyltransferase substrate binding protein [Muribaculaceae bacterium]|nr:nucleotidyltransferase substrate binding protein [Muribaculaceae bacterium]
MIPNSAIRFAQRLDSFSRAFTRLDELVKLMSSEASRDWLFGSHESGIDIDIAREALIKRFEFTQELSWNVLKDYLTYQGVIEISGSRDTYRHGLRLGLIDSPVWMDMITDRNLSAHDYNNQKASEICERIITLYHPLLRGLKEKMTSKLNEIPGDER